MSVTPTAATGTLSPLVAKRIRGLMGEQNLSGAELARRLGVSQMWVSDRVRTAKTPIDLNDLDRIAGVLGVSYLDLIPGARLNASTTAQQHTSPQTAAHAASFTSPRGIRSRRRLAGSVAA